MSVLINTGKLDNMATITLPKGVQVYSAGVTKTLNDRIAGVQSSNATPTDTLAAPPTGYTAPTTVNNVALNAIDGFSGSLVNFSSSLDQYSIQLNAIDLAKVDAQGGTLYSGSLQGNTTIVGSIRANNSVGTTGQYLASGGAGNTYWATFSVAGTPSLDAVMSVGATTSRALSVSNTASITGHTTIGPIAGSTSSGNQTSLEIKNNGGTGDSDVAAISYHCAGYYGIHQHLRADGYFGIGGWSASTWRWYVDTTNGDMTAAGNITAYSDPRLKEDITPIESALDKVLRWNGVRYRWKDTSVIGHPGTYDYGVLSSDIEPDAPELVVDSVWESPDGDMYKTVVYDKLTPFLIEAIKEQQAQIEDLKKQVLALQTKA